MLRRVLGARVGVGQAGALGADDEIAPPPRDGEPALDAALELVPVPRLQEVLVRVPVVDGTQDARRVAVCRDDDAHRVGPLLDDLAQELDAADLRHSLVAQHQGDVLAVEDLQCLGGAPCGAHTVGAPELLAKELEVVGLVVDEEEDEGGRAR